MKRKYSPEQMLDGSTSHGYYDTCYLLGLVYIFKHGGAFAKPFSSYVSLTRTVIPQEM